jgi:hypothetical protein
MKKRVPDLRTSELVRGKPHFPQAWRSACSVQQAKKEAEPHMEDTDATDEREHGISLL